MIRLNKKVEDQIGTILSGSTTNEATCQLLEHAERGDIKEGMLLVVKSGDKKILARVAQIIPYNEFYSEGGPWSEPIRKKLPIPEDVARRYEICRLDLLMELPRADIRNPPQPGDPVLRLDPIEHGKEIFGVAQEDPYHIWYGSLIGYEGRAPVPLNIENLPMHMAIFGVTGSGKSFDAGVLIERLANIPVRNGRISYPLIVVDAHGDYIDYAQYTTSGKKLYEASWVRRYVFPKAITLESRNLGIARPIGINLDLLPQRELAEIIILYYKGTTEGAELQIDALDTLFNTMKDNEYNSIQEIFLYYFKDLENTLDKEISSDIISTPTKSAVRRALNSFKAIESEYKLLSTESDLQKAEISGGKIQKVQFVEEITREGGVVILDFSANGAPGVDLKTKQLIMTYLASLLFEQFTNYKIKNEERYLLFIIEEAQNFCPDKSYPISTSLAHAKLSAIATQGRKFGLSLCLISQRPSFVDRIVLSMCNSFLIHRISPEDVTFVKSITGGLPASLATKLTTLDRGNIILCGQMNTVPFPLLIHVAHNERMVEHTIGKTNVCETLAKLRGG
jgi:DNA helicase HerA-like ATPase